MTFLERFSDLLNEYYPDNMSGRITPADIRSAFYALADRLYGDVSQNATGYSAYQVWQQQDGNEDKTVAEFLESLIPDHSWTGTALRFIKPDGSNGPLVDLKGAKGDTGATGAKGDKGDAGSLAAAVLSELSTWLATDRLVVQQSDNSFKKVPISLVLPIGSGATQIPTNNLLGTAAFAALNTLATLAGNNTFSGSNTFTGNVSVRRLTATGSQPSVTGGLGAGAGATVSILSGSTDMAGTLQFITASSPQANQTIATVTFNTALSAAPKVVMLTARNNQAGMAMTKFYVSSKSDTGWVLSSTDATLTTGTTYQLDYLIIA